MSKSNVKTPRSPEALNAIKEERLRKLFEAMGKPSTEQLDRKVKQAEPQSQAKAQVDRPKAQASSSKATASSSSSAASSSLSPEAAKKLTEFFREMPKTPPELPTNVEERDSIEVGLNMLQTVAPSMLPPALGQKQRRVLMLHEHIQELLKEPDESLSPELRALKHQVLDIRAKMPKDPYESREVERRINEALAAEGEPPIKMPYREYKLDFSKGPGHEPTRIFKEGNLEAEEREARRRMMDLARRKPKLHATIYRMVVEHDAHLKKNRASQS